MDAHADPYWRQSAPAALLVVGVQGCRDPECRPAGARGVIGLLSRRTPKGHQRVADILVHGPLPRLDTAVHQRKVLVEESHHLRRWLALGNGREARDVGEQDADVTVLRGDRARRPLVHEPLHQGPWDVGGEQAKPLDHGVEGRGRLVQLTERTLELDRRGIEIEIAHAAGRRREPSDRAAQGSPQQQGESKTQKEHDPSDLEEAREPSQLGTASSSGR